MKRRGLLAFAAVGAAAAALGVAVGWRASPRTPDGSGTEALFAASFPDVEGRPQPLAQWRGRPLVVNFWATWCPPCVEEMPDLQTIRDAYLDKGVEVIGIGIDSAGKIAAFREKHLLTLPLLVAGVGGSELNRALGNSGGALPYTVVVDSHGRIVEQHLGQVSPAQLRRWLDRALATG